jgi:hypothetical protein
MDDKIAAALIAAGVSVLGVFVSAVSSIFIARSTITSKLSELEQTQLKDIVAKRLEAYPKLWAILQARVSNWLYEGKRTDGAWAAKLYNDLNECHAEYGALFSQPVYEAFCDVRLEARQLAETYGPGGAGKEVPNEAAKELDKIWSQGRCGRGSLAAELKNDLGSYHQPIISR